MLRNRAFDVDWSAKWVANWMNEETFAYRRRRRHTARQSGRQAGNSRISQGLQRMLQILSIRTNIRVIYFCVTWSNWCCFILIYAKKETCENECIYEVLLRADPKRKKKKREENDKLAHNSMKFCTFVWSSSATLIKMRFCENAREKATAKVVELSRMVAVRENKELIGEIWVRNGQMPKR